MSEDSLIAFAQMLIRQRSLSGEEGAVVELIISEMQRLGFDQIWKDKNGSAIGVIKGTQLGPTLLLDGHCDTVGVAPGVSWTHDLFGGEIKEGVIYGRGAADMKGALAAMIYAAASVDRSHLKGEVAVSATVMEESLEGASLQTVMEDLAPDFVVIGEATDLNLNRGGRGRAEIHLETIGRPAHSSSPHLGRNAVHDMTRVIRLIESLPVKTDALVGQTVFALTDIISDPYPACSMIPSRCRVTYDRRLIAGESPGDVLDAITGSSELQDISLRAEIATADYHTYTGAILRGTKFLPAWAFPETDSFVQACLRGLRKAGLTPKIGAYRFCTNAAYSAGMAGVPTVGFGPGREEDAHTVDEHLGLESLITAKKGYRGIIDAVLSESNGHQESAVLKSSV